MAKAEGRTPRQIRAEIETERERLKGAVAELEIQARQTGRIALYVLGAAVGAIVLTRVVRGRRRRS